MPGILQNGQYGQWSHKGRRTLKEKKKVLTSPLFLATARWACQLWNVRFPKKSIAMSDFDTL